MKNKKLFFFEDQPEFIRTFMFLLCLIFILLLTYIVGVLILSKDSILSGDTSDSDVYFKDCKILEKKCADVDCAFYSWCGGGDYKVCRIYDCGNKYGVFTVDTNNSVNTKREDKIDTKAFEAKKEACSGNMQVLEQKCEEGKMQIKVKLTTKGECKVGNFTLLYEKDNNTGGGAQSTTFTALEDGTYQLTANTCGTVAAIIPSTEDGIALEF